MATKKTSKPVKKPFPGAAPPFTAKTAKKKGSSK